jgi:hypothetical protein
MTTDVRTRLVIRSLLLNTVNEILDEGQIEVTTQCIVAALHDDVTLTDLVGALGIDRVIEMACRAEEQQRAVA